MRHGLLCVVALGLCKSMLAAEAPPIPLSPSHYTALALGEPSSSVVVDLFVDLACSDTRDAWPTIKKVMTNYDSKVLFRFHLFPLPYHQYAYALAKTAVIVTEKANATSTFRFFDTAFALQDKISNTATADKSFNEVLATIQEWATDGTGLSLAQVQAGWKDSDLEMATRYEFKYTAIRSVFGTPSIYLNDMALPSFGSDTSYKKWSELLDAVLRASPPQRLKVSTPILDASQQAVEEEQPHSQLAVLGAFIPALLVLALVVGVWRAYQNKSRRDRSRSMSSLEGGDGGEVGGRGKYEAVNDGSAHSPHSEEAGQGSRASRLPRVGRESSRLLPSEQA